MGIVILGFLNPFRGEVFFTAIINPITKDAGTETSKIKPKMIELSRLVKSM